MSTTFYQLWNRIIGDVGSDMPAPKAKQIIQDAWRTVLNARPWSFLLREGVLIAPAVITGDVTFTQYSSTATAAPALAAILNALASPPIITRRSLRVSANTGVTSATAPIYDIYGYDGVNLLTLNRAYQEDSGLRTINIFRRFFLPPANEFGVETTDFQRWLNVIDPDDNFPLDTSKPKRLLDFWDPNRTSTGTPFALCQAPAATIAFPGVSFDGNLQPGAPIYELYPHYLGNTQKTYLCYYQAHGKDFTDDYGSVDSVLPPYIPEDLLMEAARVDAYRWAETNKGRIPSFARVNWLALMKASSDLYDKKYLEARRVDEEHYKQNWAPRLDFRRRRGFWGGADYWQTHAMPYWWGMPF